ncbi:hypothetical protein [Phaeobacter sp. J2-8]|nr:hypothetical protein [Phaeobacter sp. J2-8]
MATLFAAQQHRNFGSCGIFGTASARRENASLPLWAYFVEKLLLI